MKYFTHIKTVLGIILLTLLVYGTTAASPFVMPISGTADPLPFLDVSSSNQIKQGWLALGSPSSYNPLGTLDVRATSIADTLSVIGKAWFSQYLFVGFPLLPGAGSIKLVVDRDHIRSSALAGSGDRPTCSDSAGNFIPCTGSVGTSPIVTPSPLCGSTANTYVTTLPTEGLCGVTGRLGFGVAPGSNGTWTWTCYAISGPFSVASCSTSPLVPTCGESANIATLVAPTSGLCYSGTASTPSIVAGGSGLFQWICSDTYGNPPVTCRTPDNRGTVTTPMGCFAIKNGSSGNAILTCAEGSAAATTYRLQTIDPGTGRWGNVAGVSSSYDAVSSSSTMIRNNPFGGWARSLFLSLPQAIAISTVAGSPIPSNDSGSGQVWRIAACNAAGSCSTYSESIFPGAPNDPLSPASSVYGEPVPVVTKTGTSSSVTLSWNYPLGINGYNLYPTVFIRRCTSPGCLTPILGGRSSAPEFVDPATVASTAIPHSPITCTGGSCTVTFSGDSRNDYMVTMGKDLYNDSRVGPTTVVANSTLTGYISSWDNYFNWIIVP